MGMKNQFAPSSPESDTPGSQAQEELRNWLETRLDVLGIQNPSTHSRLVLNFLRFPNSVFNNTLEQVLGVPGSSGGDGSLRFREQDKIRHDNEQRQILVDNLMNLCDQIYPINMLVDELSSKLKKLREFLIEDKENSTRFTDELENNLATFSPEDGSAYTSFPTSQSSSAGSPFQQQDRQFFNNKTSSNKINLRNAENGGVEKERGERIIKPVNQQTPLQYGAGIAFSSPTACNMEEYASTIDASSLMQLHHSVFNENIEAIWPTGIARSSQMEGTWPSYVWLPPRNSINDRLVQELTAFVPVIPWYGIIGNMDYAMASRNRNPGHDTCKQESQTNTAVEECSVLLNEPTNAAGHSIWCSAAAEDNSFKDFEVNGAPSVPINPQESDRVLPQAPQKSPVDDREKDRAILDENLPEPKSEPEPEPEPEDLLTSARTHFRPIKDDGEWVDGTTFPIDSSVERITYRRSESGRLYLPGSETPYMEYRDNNEHRYAEQLASFVIRFPVCQYDRATQTDPADTRSPPTGSLIKEFIDSDTEDSESDSISEIDFDIDFVSDSENDSKIDSKNDSKIDPENDSKRHSENDPKNDCGNDPTMHPDCSALKIQAEIKRWVCISRIETNAGNERPAYSTPLPKFRRQLIYDDPDDSSIDLPLDIEDPEVEPEVQLEPEVQQAKAVQTDEGGGNFDLHFPPLPGHSPSTSYRLRTVVPVHYNGERIVTGAL